jgi:hypothetical protein
LREESTEEEIAEEMHKKSEEAVTEFLKDESS